MTRARETLALVQLEDVGRPDVRDRPLPAKREERAASLLQPFGNDPSVLEREVPPPDISDRRLDIRITECTMKDVVLSFAGWRAAHSKCHRAIAALAPGDPLSMSHEDGQCKILDHEGRQVGRMASQWTLPDGMAVARVSVQGIFTRWADDEEDEERKRMLRSETWEVVVPQFSLSRSPSPAVNRPRAGSAD